MITYQQADETLKKWALLNPLGSPESVSLDKAAGRTLSEAIYSPENVPSFEHSAMDGFAIHASETKAATKQTPVRIEIREMIAAGDPVIQVRESASDLAKTGYEIMTGAPMPICNKMAKHYDAVVKIEDVRVERDSSNEQGRAGKALAIYVSAPVEAEQNVREIGEDFKEGVQLLKEGTKIEARHLMSLAALGISQIKVNRKPRVAILGTGKELVEWDSKGALEPGKIRNSSSIFLMSALSEAGVDARYFGIIRDDVTKFEDSLKAILGERFDLILTTGAVSMGQYDFIPASVRRLGGKEIFHKVAIRPGKPVYFAEIDGSHGKVGFLGLPGNPISTAVGLRFFAFSILGQWIDLKAYETTWATVTESFNKPAGLMCFYKAQLRDGEAGPEVTITEGQASFMVSPLLYANTWAILDQDAAHISKGERIRVCKM